MIEKNISLLMAMVKSAIYKQDFQEDCSGAAWESIYDMAGKNRLIPLLYHQMEQLAKEYTIPKDIIGRWEENTIGTMMYELGKYKLLSQLLSAAKEKDITLIIFKGCVLADLYPDFYTRSSTDTDILVYQRDKEKATWLLEELGFTFNGIISKEKVLSFDHKSLPYRIELHLSLWEDFEGSRIDMLEEMKLTEEKSLINIKACGLEITTLGFTQHLIYQIFHIVKHFTIQGVCVRYLTDISLYISRYKDDIDIKAFWDSIERLGYSRFCRYFFHICAQYFGMPSDILKDRQLMKNEDVEVFFMDLINVGSSYSEANRNMELLGTFTPYFTGEKGVSDNKVRRLLPLLFPSMENLPQKYGYAKKSVVLLPIAWLHRLGDIFIKQIAHKKDRNLRKEKYIVIEHRLLLMKDLGLMEGGDK